MATKVERAAKLSRDRRVASLRIRERSEELESTTLAPYATRSAEGRRDRPDEPSPTRMSFAVDRDRIIHSKAFRRTKHKTQVFLAPVGDHYRTRLTHILEVNQIGRAIARSLRLNEDLVEAMALGHDIGHTPSEGGLEIAGLGETETPENSVVRYADKIACLHHDIDNAMRAGIITEADLPADLRTALGSDSAELLDTMIYDVIVASYGKADVTMSPEVLDATNALRKFMFDNVYLSGPAKTEDE